MTDSTQYNEAEALARIGFLRTEIERHNDLYYKHARPLIPDAEWDAMDRELRELEERFPDLVSQDSPTRRVGTDSDSRFPSLVHSRSMISLQNSYDRAEVASFIDRVHKDLGVDDVAFTVEPKIDGVAVALRYEAGELAVALTRGDGNSGDVITANMRTLEEIPIHLKRKWGAVFGANPPDSFEVRGEVYMCFSQLARLNACRKQDGLDVLANPRNATAGSMKTLDAEIVRHRGLKLFCYRLFPLTGESDFPSHGAEMAAIRALGLPTNPFLETARTAEEVDRHLRKLGALRRTLDYPIDGAVIKVDLQRWQAVLGETAKTPRWGLAFKYAAETAETSLTAVSLQVGRTGVITPVAELEPVVLAGSRVSRATLHNWEDLERKDVRVGDRVVIAKGGDVIPKVVEVLVEARRGDEKIIERPIVCPVCGEATIRRDDEVAIRCVNSFCPAVLAGRIRHFVSRDACDIEGLGSRGVEQLLSAEQITSAVDLFRLDADRLTALPGWGEKSAATLRASAAAAVDRPWANKLFALGIPHVGLGTATILARAYGNLEALRRARDEDLAEHTDIGPVVGRAVVAFFNEPGPAADFVRDLESVGFFRAVEKTPPERVAVDTFFSGGGFVFTGTLKTMTRAEARKAIIDRGGKVTSSVSSRTTAVIAGKQPGSKLARAERLQVQVLDEAQFCRRLDADGGADER